MNTISRETLKAHLDRKDPIVLLVALPEKYLVSGHLPGAQLPVGLGYSSVQVYTGGKKDWESAGFPLEK